MEKCYWILLSVIAGLTDMHFLYQWELVKDLFSPIVKNGYQFSHPWIRIERPCLLWLFQSPTPYGLFHALIQSSSAIQPSHSICSHVLPQNLQPLA